MDRFAGRDFTPEGGLASFSIGRSFAAQYSIGSVAAEYGIATLINPSTSGRFFALSSFYIAPASTANFVWGFTPASYTTNAVNIFNMLAGGSSATGLAYWASSAAPTINNMGYARDVATSGVRISTPAFVIPPGYQFALAFTAPSVNITASAFIYWSEL